MKPGIACSVTVRSNLTLMVTAGDQALEVAMQPAAAMELARDLLTFGLRVAEERAAARMGATAAIERAKAPALEGGA